jgi:hypothetical protein
MNEKNDLDRSQAVEAGVLDSGDAVEPAQDALPGGVGRTEGGGPDIGTCEDAGKDSSGDGAEWRWAGLLTLARLKGLL